MKISFSACIAILSASPPSADIFVEGASFRGLMSKLSSRTTANDNNNNPQGATATVDEVVHVDLDQQAIALAETTDVHPHLATSDPEQQVDRHLSSCTPIPATEYYTPPDPPDCCTEKAWHPTYAAGWTNGYCRFVADCNSPSYSSEVACCNGAYRGQVSGVCFNSLPNPPTGSPTDLGEGVYYPDYSTDWVDAKCINDRPWPFTEGGRPTYTNMKDCCDRAYAGQITKACITAYYESFPDPPTGSPTEFGEGTYYPDYDTDWVDAACINTKPVPSGRPVYISMLSCCNSAYAGQVSKACLEAYYESFPNPPTGSPTDLGEGSFYPDYETKWEDATCLNIKPFPFTPGSRPLYNSQLECCKMAYAGQTSKACLAGLPDGLRPTSSPTGPGGAGWYNNQNGGDAAVRVCTQETPRPQWGTSGDYDSLLECCNKEFGWQTSKACYCEATQCAAGIEVCGEGGNRGPSNPFDANVGCESCSGDYACDGATGSIGNTGNPGCKDCASCVGEMACVAFGYDKNNNNSKEGGSIGTSSCVGLSACYGAFGTIGDESCLGEAACQVQTGTIGDQSCTKGPTSSDPPSCAANQGIIGDGSCTEPGSCDGAAGTSEIGNDSCKGKNACGGNAGEIGNDSCNAEGACISQSGTIGDESCLGQGACDDQTGTIGDQSCTKGSATSSEESCGGNDGIIGDGSCTELGSCVGAAGTSEIGNDSCKGKNACFDNAGEIGNDSCNAETACSDGSGLDSTVKVGSGSCNAKNACNALQANLVVGNNSCNRSTGCNDCQDAVPDNQCNGGTGDVCPDSCN